MLITACHIDLSETIMIRKLAFVTTFVMLFLAAGNVWAEPDECVELKARVCTLCGDGGEACTTIKGMTDSQESCTEALESMNELDALIVEYPEEKELVVDTFCSTIAEYDQTIGEGGDTGSAEACTELQGIVCSWCGADSASCSEFSNLGSMPECVDVVEMLKMLEEIGMTDEEKQAFCEEIVQ